MDTATAHRILNNPRAEAAAAQFARHPMQTDTETYRTAMDYLQAVLVVACATEVPN